MSSSAWNDLYNAAARDDVDAIETALKNGADIDGATYSGETALLRAAFYGNLDSIRYLCDNGADMNIEGKSGYIPHTPLMVAIERGRLPIIRELIERGAIITRQTMRMACYDAHHEQFKLLVESGYDVNGCIPHDREDDITWLIHAVENEEIICTEILLDNGADANATKANGWTALHSAACRGNMDIIKLLIRHGASTNRRYDGRTPIDVAKLMHKWKAVALLDGM